MAWAVECALTSMLCSFVIAELLFGAADDPLGALRWTLADLRRALGTPHLLRGAIPEACLVARPNQESFVPLAP